MSSQLYFHSLPPYKVSLKQNCIKLLIAQVLLEKKLYDFDIQPFTGGYPFEIGFRIFDLRYF